MRVVLLAVCVVLAGCGGKSGMPKVRLATIGVGLQTLHAPISIAEAMGYFKEEGLDVTLENLPSNSKTLQALIGGSVDVAGIHYMQTIQMAAEGQRLRTFFLMTHRGGFVLAVAPAAAAKIRRVEDLKGAVIGVPSPGSPTHLNLNYLLLTHGIKPSEVSTVGTGVAAAAVSAVESGRVDAAALSGGDHFRLLRRNPALRILMDTTTVAGMREAYGTDALPTGALAARQEWLDGNPDTARRLARALARANQWILTHTPEEIRERFPEGLRSEDAAADIEIIRWSLPTYTTGGRMPEGAPEAMKRVLDMTLDNVRNAKIDLGATWTNAFLPAGK